MPVSDILQKMRMPGGAQQVDSQGLQQPAFDPIQLIAGLLGPALMRGMVGAGAGAMGGAGAGAAEQAAPEGFSQIDSLLARLKANQPKVRAGMMGDQLQSASEGLTGIRHPLPSGAGVLDQPMPPAGAQMPPISDPLQWLEHPAFWERPGIPFASGFPEWMRGMENLLKTQVRN